MNEVTTPWRNDVKISFFPFLVKMWATLISYYNDIYDDIETQIFFQNNDIEIQL